MVHQSSNKYPLLHLQTLPPLLLLPSPASPQIRRPLTSPSSPPLARLTSDAPTPHLPSSSWPAQATGGAPFHNSSDVAPAPRRSEPGEEVPLGAGTTPSCCRNRWIRGRGRRIRAATMHGLVGWAAVAHGLADASSPLPCSPAGAPRRSRG